jgi:hypothetical protein
VADWRGRAVSNGARGSTGWQVGSGDNKRARARAWAGACGGGGLWARGDASARRGAASVGRGQPSRGEGFSLLFFLFQFPSHFLSLLYIYTYISDFLGVK